MRKVYLSIKLAMVALCLSFSTNSFSQTYSAWSTGTSGAYDLCTAYGDTMRFSFSGLPPGAFGMAKLVVYFQGDYGDAIESAQNFLSATPGGPNIAMVGTNGPFTAGIDCSPEDSVVLMFNTSLITSLGTSIYFKSIPNSNVDPGVCATIQTKMRLEFDYCAAGTPSEYAHVSISDNIVCPYQLVALMGTPIGGTFSGPGVIGSNFDASSLPAGNYTITYTGTDGIGCTTMDDTVIKVLASPIIDDYVVCYGDLAHVVPGSGSSFIYYSDPGLTSVIDTTFALDYGPLMSSQTIYALDNDEDYAFGITSMLATPAVIVDHGTPAGDDRGGIAVTPNYVYVNGDVALVRYDHALTAGSATVLPQRDGIFSDLNSGRLYTLWNATSSTAPTAAPGTFTVNALMELDDMAVFSGSLISLSAPIVVNSGSRIYAGAGIVILFVSSTSHFYVIDINTGEVTDLGVAITTPNQYGTENWLSWGVAEYDGSAYSVVFRSNSGAIISRLNIGTGAVTTVATFTNLSDMASITYSRWDNKWYWKYEGSGQWGGSVETLGSLDATHTFSVLSSSGGAGCYTEVELTVPQIAIGSDVYFCQGDEADFSVGLGYSSISWNGNNSDLNTYTATSSQQVIIEAVESSTGCTVMDTANAVMNPLPSVSLSLGDDHACTTQSSFALTGGLPAGGIFSGSFVSGSNFNASSAGNGTHIVTYTYIDANGCANFAQDAVFVDACVGVDELGNALVSVYPNPANAFITINAGSYVGQPVSIDIYDAQGKLVYSEKNTLVSNHEISVAALNNGVYNISLTVDGNRSMAKLVIQK